MLPIVDYECRPPKPSRRRVFAQAIGALACAGIFLASIWAGSSRKYGGEYGGWFIIPALLSFAGFFAILVLAGAFGPRRRAIPIAGGMLACVGIYLGSVWAGNKYGGEDGGWFIIPAILSVVGFFAIPIFADGFNRHNREKD